MGMLGVPVVVDPNGIQIGHFSNTEANSSREAGRGKNTQMDRFWTCRFWSDMSFQLWQLTLPKTNSSHLAGGWAPKRKLIFQPQCFRCYVSFREGSNLQVFLSVLSFNGSAENNQRQSRSCKNAPFGQTPVGAVGVFCWNSKNQGI